MGKSAVRLIQKMAMVEPVSPRPDKNGIKQPDYVRSKTAIHVSPKLNWHKSCVATKLAGKKFGNRLEVRRALANAAKECKAQNPY